MYNKGIKLINMEVDMTKFLLSEHEHNGYSDSDFYAVYFDTLTRTVGVSMIGTTRFAGGFEYGDIDRTTPLSDDVIDGALDWLEQAYFVYISKVEQNKVDHPNDIKPGQRVRLLTARKGHKWELSQECNKCDGSGEWVNPKNDEDVRECFACNGAGHKWEKAPKVDGKLQWDRFEEGTTGTVVWAGTFNKIWRNGGYNQYDRSTIQTRVVTDDGRLMNAPLSELSLDTPYPSDDELRERAYRFALTCQFGKMVSAPHAWDTFNRVAQALDKRLVK